MPNPNPQDARTYNPAPTPWNRRPAALEQSQQVRCHVAVTALLSLRLLRNHSHISGD